MKEKIFVTRPTLPELQNWLPILNEIWESRNLTNGGKFHELFEKELAAFLGVKHISLFNNGTIALLTAIQALDLKGEVITTPFTFVATAHSIMWNNLTPVFADISPNSFNINPRSIEKMISEDTSAILPVHCYGYPCEAHTIEKIAKQHNLKVIYDGAHAFNVKINGQSIFNFGDLSILSFHATKVFNTFEGGAIISQSEEMKKKIDELKNFGIVDNENIEALGLNGKMSELNSSIGLLQLKSFKDDLKRRHENSLVYKSELNDLSEVSILPYKNTTTPNYSYFPILIKSSKGPEVRDELFSHLASHNVFARKYFFPLISNVNIYKNCKKDDLINSILASNQVLCLPLYPDLSNSEISYISSLVREFFKK